MWAEIKASCLQLLITAQERIHLSWRQFGRWTLFTPKAVWGALGGSHQSVGYLQKKEPMLRHQFQSLPRDRWYGKLPHKRVFSFVFSFFFFLLTSSVPQGEFFSAPQGSMLLMCLIIKIIIFPKNTHCTLPFGSLAVWHLAFLISIFN